MATLLADLGFVTGETISLNGVTFTVDTSNAAARDVQDLIGALHGASDGTSVISVSIGATGTLLFNGNDLVDDAIILGGTADLGNLGLTAGTYGVRTVFELTVKENGDWTASIFGPA